MKPLNICCLGFFTAALFFSCSPKISTNNWILLDSYTFDKNTRSHTVDLPFSRNAVKFQAIGATASFDSVLFIHTNGSVSKRLAGHSVLADQYTDPISFPSLLGKIRGVRIYVHFHSFPENIVLKNHSVMIKTFVPADR